MQNSSPAKVKSYEVVLYLKRIHSLLHTSQVSLSLLYMHKLGSECNGAILSDLIKVRDKVNECFELAKECMHSQSQVQKVF